MTTTKQPQRPPNGICKTRTNEGHIVKTRMLTSYAASFLLAVSFAMAQSPTDEHAEHHPEGASPPASSSQLPAKGNGSASMRQMQENMKLMQDLMTKIHATKDNTERTRLLRQHSKAMQDQMQRMREMNSDPSAMPKGDMKMDGAKGSGSSAPEAESSSPMGKRMMNHRAMQRRMEMMEMMMGQMMQHQEAQEGSKTAN